MNNRDLSVLNKFLAKVKDSSRQGLREVRIETRDAVEITTLLAQILLSQQTISTTSNTTSGPLDGGGFK